MRDYSRSEIEYGIEEWIIGKNADRNKLILRLKLIHGYSYNAILNELHSGEYPDSYKMSLDEFSIGFNGLRADNICPFYCQHTIYCDIIQLEYYM